jgi:hypothetical protein
MKGQTNMTALELVSATAEHADALAKQLAHMIHLLNTPHFNIDETHAKASAEAALMAWRTFTGDRGSMSEQALNEIEMGGGQ